MPFDDVGDLGNSIHLWTIPLDGPGFVRHLESSEARDASYFEVVRPPLAALDKWRDQLSSEQIARIERIVCHAEIGRRFFEGP